VAPLQLFDSDTIISATYYTKARTGLEVMTAMDGVAHLPSD